MLYLLIGGAILLLVVSGRGQGFLKRDGWRIGAGALSIAAFAGAAYTGVRGAWGTSVVLVVLGVWSATIARQRPVLGKSGVKRTEDPSLTEARSILGVGPEASRDDIQSAYARLIRLAHPDKGGTAGLAAQLNAARDRLLNGR
jgi:hypothetical protein